MIEPELFRPKDFVETREGFVFALLDGCPEDDRLPAVLRYVRSTSGVQKLSYAQSLRFLLQQAPDLVYASTRMDIELAGVPLDRIVRHYAATQAARACLQVMMGRPALAHKAHRCLTYLLKGEAAEDRVGITGSLLVGVHGASSDIDLVVYDPDMFRCLQSRIEQGIGAGFFSDLAVSDWQEAYDRRACALSFEAYLWHERRKFNKALIEGTKFDLSLAPYPASPLREGYVKQGVRRLKARVVDDNQAFSYPACFQIDDPDVPFLYVFTHTYVGQARAGEWIDAQGILESGPQGETRLIIGTSREAEGEWLQVITEEQEVPA